MEEPEHPNFLHRMAVDDGQVMGIIVYVHEEGYQGLNVFVSYQPRDAFDYTEYGAHCVVMYGMGHTPT